ncbi:MAG: hypothetical protein RLZZ200_1044 [Pseudomonadota bacterium]
MGVDNGKRWGALLAVKIALFVSPSTLDAAASGTASEQRNIIFVLVDDLRFDGMGFLQPQIRTPNIDRMAREGSYFPNARVTSSLCSPSRASILTGMSARNHGVVDNNHSSEKGLVYFPSYLKSAGYQTSFFGKWHMGDDSDAPRPGFDKWVSFLGQGNYWPTTGINESRKAAGAVNLLNVDGKRVPQKGYITDELTDYAMEWLEKKRDPKRPFFLYLSHKAVHSDPLPATRHAHQYDGVSFPLPASAADTPENRAGKPMWVHNQRNTWHGIDFFYHADVKMPDYLRYYYATLSAVDDSLGRILNYLEQNHLDRNTLVVFTSDNGYQIGEHGLIDKRTAYEPSVRVPLLAWEPGTVPAGRTENASVRNLDFAPTFLDAAGVKAPPQFEGRSVWSMFRGAAESAREATPDFVYEYYWEYNFPMTPTTFSIKRGNLKYIQYYGVYDLEELYDLDADPQEMHNLADRPAYFARRMELRAALYESLADRQGRHVIPYGERQSIGAVRRKRGGTGAAPFPDSWLIAPDPVDRFDDIMPDSAAKQAAQASGTSLLPAPPLAEELRRQVVGP